MSVDATPTAMTEGDASANAGSTADPRPRNRYGIAFRSAQGIIGLSIVLLIVLISVVGPWLLSQGPFEQGPDSLIAPGGTHLLGTDELGRDLLARVLAGTRVDLVITLIAVPVAAVAGTLLGLLGSLSATVGGLLQRTFDVLLGVPALILGIGVAIVLLPGRTSVIVAIILVTMPVFGRQANNALQQQLPLDYVAAARVLGYPKRRVMMRHILPNVIDVVFVRFAIEIAHAITIEGGLSVVGLGIQAPQPSLGSMIKDGSGYLIERPLYALAPVAVVVLLIIGYTMLSGALNQAVLRK